MPQSLAQLYIHLVFSTENRVSWFSPEIRGELHAYLSEVSNTLGAPSLRVGGVDDHVHVLARFPRTVTIAEWVGKLKANSSRWYKKRSATHDHGGFAWQQGYGCFSASPNHVEGLIKYIENQEQHHQNETYQDEYRRLLRKYAITYDERYVWG